MKKLIFACLFLSVPVLASLDLNKFSKGLKLCDDTTEELRANLNEDSQKAINYYQEQRKWLRGTKNMTDVELAWFEEGVRAFSILDSGKDLSSDQEVALASLACAITSVLNFEVTPANVLNNISMASFKLIADRKGDRKKLKQTFVDAGATVVDGAKKAGSAVKKKILGWISALARKKQKEKTQTD